MSALPARAAFHSDYLRRLCGASRDDGADVDRVLAYAGLDRAWLAEADGPMSFEAARWLILASIDALPRPSLALDLGRAMRLEDHGPMGRLAACSPTLRRALAALQCFGSLRVGALRLTMQRRGAAAELVVDEAIALGDVRRFVMEHAAASLVGLVRELTGRDAKELTLHMPFEAPAWRSAYRELAGTVHFGAKRMALEIPEAWLAQRCAGADEHGWRRAWADCRNQASRRQHGGVTDQVRSLLGTAGGLTATLDELATRLGLSRRTLNRRLQVEGTSFSELADAARQREALRLLRDRQVSVNEIALRLRIDSSNVGRSFKRWFGATPMAIRGGRVPWPAEQG